VAHKRAKRSVESSVTIDDITLVWTLAREPRMHTDGYKGMAISVTLAVGSGRELLLEYPYPKYRPGPQRNAERPRILPATIEKDIRAAMQAGWDPVSRGRVFAFQVEAGEGS
jgi:hypothetical protein